MSSFADRVVRRSRRSNPTRPPTGHRTRRAVATSVAGAVLMIATTVVVGSSTVATAEAGTFDEYAASPELAGDHADVFRLYWAFFDRKPEVGGAQYWVGQYDQCASLLNITWSFGNSAEFVNTYGPLNDRDYTTLVYANVLDREPDDGGYDYWLEPARRGHAEQVRDDAVFLPG